jgi:CTP synthase
VHLHAPHAAALHQGGSGELKTKPTQHSVKELRSIGIAPDILVCRSEQPIPKRNARKSRCSATSARGGDRRQDLEIDLRGAAQPITAKGWTRRCWTPSISAPPPGPIWPLGGREDRIENPDGEVKVAIVGKYTQLEDAYKSIAEALTHGGMANRVKVQVEWVDAELFEREDPAPISKASTPSSCRAASASAAPRARSRPPNSPANARSPTSASASACRWP